MENPIFQEIRESLTSNTVFTHTNYSNAEEFFENLPRALTDKVNVCVVGPSNYIDVPVITGLLTRYLRILGGRDNVRLLTYRGKGVQNIVKNYARRNELELDIYDIDGEAIDEYSWASQRRQINKDMVRNAHVVLIYGKGKYDQELYDEARVTGRLLMRLMPNLK